jgi:Ni/Co efflux regulator RcnB
MKYLATAAVAAVLTMASAAQAQQPAPDEHHWQGHGQNQDAGGRPQGGPQPGAPQGGATPNRDAQNHGWSGQPGQPANGQSRGWSQNRGQGWTAQQGWQNARPGEHHELRGRDQGRAWYNWNRFPHEQYAGRRYHLGAYYYPRGWYARTWYYGDILPYGWYAPRYYLNDWMAFALPPPPIGCEWVRMGPDAVLVDIWSGRVLSVYRGIFW